jgi:hypothetical protein
VVKKALFENLWVNEGSNAQAVLLEPDSGMNSRTRLKAGKARNLRVIEHPIERAEFPTDHFDLIGATVAAFAGGISSVR